MVALIIPDITNPYYPTLARGIQDTLQSNGYQMFVCSTDGRAERERRFLNDSLQRRVDGVALAGFATTPAMLGPLIRANIPVVSFGSTTVDGKVTVEFAECIGACEGAPAVLVNDEARMNVTLDQVDGLLNELRS